MVELREESPRIQAVSPRPPPPNRGPSSRGRRRLSASGSRSACRTAINRNADSLIALPVCRNSHKRSGVMSTGPSITSKGRANRWSTKRTARTLRSFSPAACTLQKAPTPFWIQGNVGGPSRLYVIIDGLIPTRLVENRRRFIESGSGGSVAIKNFGLRRRAITLRCDGPGLPLRVLYVSWRLLGGSGR